MPDHRFFKKANPASLREICNLLELEVPTGHGDIMINNVAGLHDAAPSDISFLDNKRYVPALAGTQAGVVILEQEYVDRLPEGTLALVSATPYRSFAMVSQFFYPKPERVPSVHQAANVAESAVIGDGVLVEAGAYIGEGAEIGNHSHIGPNAIIDAGVVIGEGSTIGAGAYVGFSLVGMNANIHPGVRIGTRGFGFAMDKQGHIDVPQLGRVVIGDNVEIGANTAIDRGMGPDTEIGSGTKIDNLVQIGHNVRIGKGCVIVAMTGIAGSTVLGDYVVCAAQSGIAGHLKIGDGAQIAAKAGVMKDVDPGAKMGGTPAVPINQWLRERLFVNKLMRKKERNDV